MSLVLGRWKFAVVVFWLLGGSGWLGAGERPRHFVLELDVAIERGGTVGVRFDFGRGIANEAAAAATVPAGTVPTTVRLQLPNRTIRGARLDPATDDSPVLIAAMRVLTDRGELLGQLDPARLRPMQQIQTIEPVGEGARVRPTAKASEPMLRLDLSPVQKRMHEAMGRRLVSPGALVGLGVVVAAMLVAAVVAAWRAGGDRRAWLAGGAVFCVVFGVRLVWLNLHARPVPFWDEWEGDVLYLLIPFAGGFLDWGTLVMPQWEHRILLTRTLTLGGTVLNGEWDPRVAMTAAAAMYAAAIGLVGTILVAGGSRIGAAVAAAVAVFAALPYDFNNLLWGGQTQMYGLVLLAVSTLVLAAAPRITWAVRLGALVGGTLSLFTMGAGPVAPGCAVGICLVRAWFEPERCRALLSLAALFFVPALIGVFLHVSSPAHVPLYATTFAQFRRAFVGVLAWPLHPHMVWATVIWLPSVVHGVLLLRRREGTTLDWFAVGLAGWGLVNAIALGYARQYEGPPFDSRFFTPIAIGVLGSCCSSVALLRRARSTRARGFVAAGLGLVVAGLVGNGTKGIAGARESGVTRGDMDQRIRIFLATGNRAPLMEKPPNHSGADVADRLESPLFQRVMPAAYRRALATARGAQAESRVEAGPVTFLARTLMQLGPVVASLGVVGFAYALWHRRQTGECRSDAVHAGRASPLRAPSSGDVRQGDVADGIAAEKNTESGAATPSSLPRDSAARGSRSAITSAETARERRVDRACYVAAGVVTMGWFLCYNLARQDGLVDEQGHIGNVHHFLENKPGWPEAMPMLPGYHFLVVSLWKLQLVPWGIVTIGRLATALITLVGFAAFALTWERLHGRPAGRATLLLALLPLTQPFTAMMYTDMPALAFAFCAIWAQVTGRRAFAAVVLVGAVALRQTSLAWAAFLIAWEWIRPDEPRQTWLRRVGWLLLLLAAAVAMVVVAGRLTVGHQHGNDFRANLATLHFGGVLLLLLGLPAWLRHAPAFWRKARQMARARPGRAAMVVVLAAGLAGWLAWRFANPHGWNRELFWEGCTFTLLRNWPLVWIDRHPWLQVASGINLVVMMLALGAVFARQPWRRELWLAVAFGMLPVLTNSLVEPRYFMAAAGGVLLFLDLADTEWRRLAVWWALLSAVHAPFVAQGLSLW